MSELRQTIFIDCHKRLDAQLVEFGGWEMPIQYPKGIISEHMACRSRAGLFDVSHMGRLYFSGDRALDFLQHVLTNNAAALEVGESQYTLIQNPAGGAIDDAYLYRFSPEEYLLVVNASNRSKDVAHFKAHLKEFPGTVMTDKTFDKAMISLQGPESKHILKPLITDGALPEPARNCLSTVAIGGARVDLARTGYTGEPLGFELFVENAHAVDLWDALVDAGAEPVGLGARDTLRLEAALPLYGHELGIDPDGQEIPIYASKLSKFAVSFSPLKGDFIGRQPLYDQFQAFSAAMEGRTPASGALPRIVVPIAVTGKGIARDSYKIFQDGRHVGYVTSGTMVPYLTGSGQGLLGQFEEKPQRRALALGLINAGIADGTDLTIEIRKKMVAARTVPYHMRSEAPPHVRSIPFDRLEQTEDTPAAREILPAARALAARALDNHSWRQNACINLIPSEMSQSLVSRMLSVSDPVNRYAEHKDIKAFSGEEIFYYQGTAFIRDIENRLNREFMTFFDCNAVESRVISGQMANTAFFSALVDFLNRSDRKSEQRRITKVMNNHIIRGGHLSAQPMGALRDFVARDPQTERPAVVNFPVLADNPYKIDVEACRGLIKDHQPELVILGKSMILHKEPVAEIRALVDEFAPGCIVMYDMAHVLGLYGPSFQEPLKEGAHVITGSTHKTFFGTQRGVIAGSFLGEDALGTPEYDLWEAVKRRTFPGSVSNHHLGTMTGLLFAAYEMNQFKDEYQPQVIANAKAFAAALRDEGLDVAGDPGISFTETHQVILNVGYGRGARIAQDLEEQNIIVNYQATPEEEGFTASGALRMGVSEMTRFGMKEGDFQALAGLMADHILRGRDIREKVTALREPFLQMQYCFSPEDVGTTMEDLVRGIR